MPIATSLVCMLSDLKTSKNRTMALSKIQVPNDVIRITSPEFARAAVGRPDNAWPGAVGVDLSELGRINHSPARDGYRDRLSVQDQSLDH